MGRGGEEGAGSGRRVGEGRAHSLAATTASIDNSCYLLRASPAQTSIYWAPPVNKSQPAPALPELPSGVLTCRGPGGFHFTEEKTEARDGESDSFLSAGAWGFYLFLGGGRDSQ